MRSVYLSTALKVKQVQRRADKVKVKNSDGDLKQQTLSGGTRMMQADYKYQLMTRVEKEMSQRRKRRTDGEESNRN